MSITVVSSSLARGSGASSTSLVVTLGAAVASGDTLALAINDRSDTTSTISSITDSVNGAWPAAIAGPLNSAAGSTLRTWFYVFENSGAGTPAITVTFNNAINSQGVAIGLHGSTATPELDVLGTTYNTAGAAETAPNSASVSATAAGLFLAGILTNNYQASPPSESGGATVGPASTADGHSFIATRAITGAGSEDFAFTGSSSRWIIFQATFIENAGGGSIVPLLNHLRQMKQ